MNKLRKLLSDEKKKVGAERHKLGEVHALFEQIYDDYSITVDTVEEAQKEIQHKVKLRHLTQETLATTVVGPATKAASSPEQYCQDQHPG